MAASITVPAGHFRIQTLFLVKISLLGLGIWLHLLCCINQIFSLDTLPVDQWYSGFPGARTSGMTVSTAFDTAFVVAL